MAEGVDDEGGEGDEEEPPDEAVAEEPVEAGVPGSEGRARGGMPVLFLGPAAVAVAVVGLSVCVFGSAVGAVGHGLAFRCSGAAHCGKCGAPLLYPDDDYTYVVFATTLIRSLNQLVTGGLRGASVLQNLLYLLIQDHFPQSVRA